MSSIVEKKKKPGYTFVQYATQALQAAHKITGSVSPRGGFYSVSVRARASPQIMHVNMWSLYAWYRVCVIQVCHSHSLIVVRRLSPTEKKSHKMVGTHGSNAPYTYLYTFFDGKMETKNERSEHAISSSEYEEKSRCWKKNNHVANCFPLS